MGAISKEFLTGTPNGKSLEVTGTVIGSANTAHTAHATSKDEVWLYACNTDSVDRTLSVYIDGQETSIVGVQAQKGLLLVIPGFIVSGSKLVQVFASAANVVFVSGWVNRVG